MIDAARAVLDAAEGLTLTSGATVAFTRGLEDLRNALGQADREATFAAVLAASRRVVEGASTDALIKARRGAAFVGALRTLRSALRDLDA